MVENKGNTGLAGLNVDQVPEPDFTEPIENITVPVGREAILSCSVQNLGGYKVTNHQSSPVQSTHKSQFTILGSASIFKANASFHIPIDNVLFFFSHHLHTHTKPIQVQQFSQHFKILKVMVFKLNNFVGVEKSFHHQRFR